MKSLLKIFSKNMLIIFLALAITNTVTAILMLGFITNFWIVLLLWIVIYLLIFISPITKTVSTIMLIVAATVILSVLISFKLILNNSTTTNGADKSANEMLLSNCTSTINDQPETVEGWVSNIYSAPLDTTKTPTPNEANNVRTFSYSGIKSKTEKNDIYSSVEKTDGSYITGYGTTMEVCNADNKTSWSYATANASYIASEGAVASIDYFHGGNYLQGAGDYRVDVYLKTLDGKWHLINRLTGITITE